MAIGILVTTSSLIRAQVASAPANASSTETREFAQKAERLRQAVYRRPRSGATFDLWYQHFQAAGKTKAWRDSILAYRDAHPDQASAQLVAGLALEKERDWSAAAVAFEKATAIDAKNLEAWLRLADVKLRQGNRADAIAALRRAGELRVPRSQQVTLSHQLGQLLAQSGETDEAIGVWTSLAARFPRDARVLADMASQLQQVGAFEQAKRLWTDLAASARDPQQRYEARFQLASLLASLEDVPEALNQYRRLLQQVQLDGWRGDQVCAAVNRLLSQQPGGNTTGVQFWREQVTRRPQQLRLRLEWADALARAGRLAQAGEQYREAVRLAPSNRTFRRRLINLAVQQNDFALALEQAEAMAKSHASDPEVWMEVAQLRLQAPQSDPNAARRRAVEAWNQALAATPEEASIALQAARSARSAALGTLESELAVRPRQTIPAVVVQRESICLQAAEAFYRQAVERSGGREYREDYGEFLHRLGRTDEALAVWRAMAPSPAQATALLDVARVARRYGHRDAAGQAARAAVTADRQVEAAWDLWIELLLESNAHAQALQATDEMRAVRGDDQAWQRAVARARIHVRAASNQLAEEIQQQEQRLAMNPDDLLAAWTLTQIWAMTGERDRAGDTLKQLVQQAPHDLTLARDYARLLDRQGDRAAAIDQYRHVIQLQTRAQPEDHQRLIALLIDAQQWLAATQAADVYAAQTPASADPYLLKSSIASSRNDTQGRVSALRQAALVAPDDGQVRRALAAALLDQGEAEAALSETLRAAEVAETLNERLSIFSWALSWTSGDRQHQTILQSLRQRRDEQPEHRDDWTECLITALESMGDLPQAIVELNELRQRRPLDTSILRRMVGLSFAAGQLDEAIDYQQQLVRLDQSPGSMERLARLYRQNGRTQRAQAIWDQLLESESSEAEALRLLDDLIANNKLYAAQQLVEATLSRHPKSAPLLLQAARLHFVHDQLDEALETLVAILRLRANQPAAAESITAEGAVQQLIVGLESQRHVMTLISRRMRYGPRHRLTMEHMFLDDYARATADGSLLQTQVNAAILATEVIIGRGSGPSTRREQQRLETDTDPEVLLIASWATQQRGIALRFAGEQSDSRLAALSHWIQLLTPPLPDEPALDYAHRLLIGYRDLRKRDEELAKPLLSIYAGMLHLAPRDTPGSVLRSDGAAEKPTLLEDLALAPWIDRLEPSARSQLAPRYIDSLLARASRGFTPQEDIALGSTAMSMCLLRAMSWEEVPESNRQAMISSLLPRYVEARARLAQRPRPSGDGFAVRLRALERALSLSWQADVEVARATRRSLTAALTIADQPRSQPVGHRQLTQHTTRAAERTAELLAALQPDWLIRVQSDGDLGARPIYEKWIPRDGLFPTTSTWIDSETLAVLCRAATLCSDEASQDRLRSACESTVPAPNGAQGETDTRHLADVRTLAGTILAWQWNDRDLAIDHLARFAAEVPTDSQRQALLIRAYVSAGRFRTAGRALQAMSDADLSNPELAQLRGTLARRWSQAALWREIEAHAGAVTSIAVTSNGRWIATGGVDGLVNIWDASSGALHKSLNDHRDIVLSVAFSPDGEELASAGYDQEIRRWQTDGWKPLPTLTGHRSAIRVLTYHGGGSELVSGGDDRQVIVWDRATGRRKFTMEHAGAVLTAAIDPTNSQLMTSGGDQKLYGWRLEDGSSFGKQPTPRGVYRGLMLLRGQAEVGQASSPATWLASGDARRLDIWHIPPRGEWQRESIPLSADVRCLVEIPSRRLIAAGCDDNTIQLLDVDTRKPRVILPAHAGRVLGLAVDPAETWLASVSLDGTLKLWRLDEF